MKVVINDCHGGFGLSDVAVRRLSEIKGRNIDISDIERDDPILVRVVEELGASANGKYSDLKIVNIPDDVDWFIDEYDGNEWVSENHRRWG